MLAHEPTKGGSLWHPKLYGNLGANAIALRNWDNWPIHLRNSKVFYVRTTATTARKPDILEPLAERDVILNLNKPEQTTLIVPN